MRCCALNPAGIRCSNTYDVYHVVYHGASELYENTSWVAVPLCPKCRKSVGEHKRYKEKKYAKEEMKRQNLLRRCLRNSTNLQH